jgi:hypothetical protein
MWGRRAGVPHGPSGYQTMLKAAWWGGLQPARAGMNPGFSPILFT